MPFQAPVGNPRGIVRTNQKKIRKLSSGQFLAVIAFHHHRRWLQNGLREQDQTYLDRRAKRSNNGVRNMLKIQLTASAIAVIMLALSGNAYAASCEGTNTRKYEKPIAVHKGKDNSVTYLLKSTGVSTRKTATGAEQGGSFQHCTGLWTVNADKSGSGSGNCYTVDKNGDYRVTSWEGSKAAGKGQKAGGTWSRLGGTGKYTGDHMSKGTWTSGLRFAEGFRIGN